MSAQDEDDDGPRRDYSDLLPIMLAMILTAAAIGLCFFEFRIDASKSEPPPPAATSNEVTVGVGEGSTIHQPAPSGVKPK